MKKIFLSFLLTVFLGTIAFAQDSNLKTISLLKVEEKTFSNEMEIQISLSDCVQTFYFQTTNVTAGSKVSYRWKDPNGTVGLVISPTRADTTGVQKQTTVANDGSYTIDTAHAICTTGTWSFYDFKVSDTYVDNNPQVFYDDLPAIAGAFTFNVKVGNATSPTVTKTPRASATTTPAPVLDSSTGSDGLGLLTALASALGSGILAFGLSRLRRKK